MKVRLPHNCSCSEPKVHPKTWNRANASIRGNWYIWYRFYDPTCADQYKTGKLVQIKGMNEFKDLHDRQVITRKLLDHELYSLKQLAFNPITGQRTEPEQIDYIIHPDTGMIAALLKACENATMQANSRADIVSSLKYICKAAEQLRIENIPIKDVKRRHIKLALEQCRRNKATFTSATFNRYRRNISVLFTYLVDIEAIEYNPVTALKKEKTTRKMKVLLTPTEREIIDRRLRGDNFEFWRLVNIFYASGARTPEIMAVRKQDVDLKRQMVKYTIKKGTVIREVERPIKNNIIYLWEQLIVTANDGDYLFSEGLKPGPAPIRVDQIKRRWRYWVQLKYGIKASWYSLKHLNSDEMDAVYGEEIAARLNEHGVDMIRNHYAPNKLAREHEIIKKAGNTFAPVGA